MKAFIKLALCSNWLSCRKKVEWETKTILKKVLEICQENLIIVSKMNYPSLYHKSNEVQRFDAQEIIKEYSHKLQWRLDGRDALLDVGTGCGDVLMDLIYPIMPASFDRIVGSDVSSKMLDYAKAVYSSHKKCDFKLLDIGTENDLPNDMTEQFDHVTSFYCLHWIQDKRQAARNIFKLLKPEGGDTLLVFLASNPIYDVYKSISKLDKWSAYMKDVDQFTNPMLYSKKPDLEISDILRKEHFSNIQVEIKHKLYVYEGLENFKDNVRAINPFLERIPTSLHESFFDDFIHIVDGFNLRQKHPSEPSDYIFNMPYKLIIAYAMKVPCNASE